MPPVETLDHTMLRNCLSLQLLVAEVRVLALPTQKQNTFSSRNSLKEVTLFFIYYSLATEDLLSSFTIFLMLAKNTGWGRTLGVSRTGKKGQIIFRKRAISATKQGHKNQMWRSFSMQSNTLTVKNGGWFGNKTFSKRGLCHAWGSSNRVTLKNAY